MLAKQMRPSSIRIRAGSAFIDGDLVMPEACSGLIVFAHGSGSSRFSRRNRAVAEHLQRGGFATLLMDLLTREEEVLDLETGEYRFDIERLAHRVVAAIEWASGARELAKLAIGGFGASTGAAAVLTAAAELPGMMRAVVSRGGRPDLAGDALPLVQTPTLLIVGGRDPAVIELNRAAMAQMHALVQLEIVPAATHLFEEPGAMETVSQLALRWFQRHLVAGR